MRNTFFEDEDFKLQWDDWKEEKVLIHCEVFNWKLSSFKKGITIFATLQEEMLKKDIKELWTFTPNPKFAALLGGKFIYKGEYLGTEFEVFKWDLIQ